MQEFQYVDLIILALIAGLVILRLRSTLGKDIGHKPDLSAPRPKLERDEGERVIHLHENAEVEREAKDALALAQIDDPEVSKQLVALRESDPTFSVKEFLDGARLAFEWVLTAFNRDDKATLKQILSGEVYGEFKQVLDSRAGKPTRPETTLVSIVSADITEVKIDQGAAKITVRYVTEQIQVERDEAGKVVSGDASKIHTIEDEWVFERPLKSRDPNWTIIDT